MRLEEDKVKLFFDTEFTGLHKDTTLVSIGIVSEDGKKFYAEFTDFDWEPVLKDKWLLDNVVNKLHYRKRGSEKTYMPDYHIGTKASISEMLENWLKQFDEVQFVSDVCHYDFVLLIDLFGGAFDLPKNVSSACHDINQDIAKHYGISEREAFDKNREDIVSELCGRQIEGEKHNSLYDAEVIKAIYAGISA